jgi:signal recognition particle GTPase
MNQIKDLQKLIRLTGDRAKLDAKANETYIVYKTDKGQIVRNSMTGMLSPLLTRMSLIHEAIPIMYVFAGNNGSGKSTIRNLIVDRLRISVNIDPDALARGLGLSAH